MKLIERVRDSARRTLENEDGMAGYVLAWFLGVPATVLILIYLLSGGR